jgi:hypothetical protein
MKKLDPIAPIAPIPENNISSRRSSSKGSTPASSPVQECVPTVTRPKTRSSVTERPLSLSSNGKGSTIASSPRTRAKSIVSGAMVECNFCYEMSSRPSICKNCKDKKNVYCNADCQKMNWDLEVLNLALIVLVASIHLRQAKEVSNLVLIAKFHIRGDVRRVSERLQASHSLGSSKDTEGS